MNELARWQRANDVYLAAALAWLRLRLEAMATDAGPIGVLAGPAGYEPLFQVRPGLEADEATAAAAVDKAAETDPPPALILLARRLGLSKFEREVLLLCAAMELDPRAPALCARAQGDPSRMYPTFALALALFEDPAWEALSPERPLRYWHLLEIHQPGAQPLTASSLRADERVVSYLKGLNYLDDRLASLLVPLDPGPQEFALPPSHRSLASRIEEHLGRPAGGGYPPVVQLIGSDGPSKRGVARRVAGSLGLSLLRLPADLLPAEFAALEMLARLWEREGLLLPLALYLECGDGGGEGPAAPDSLRRFVARCSGLLFLDARRSSPDLGRESLVFAVDKPTAVEQRSAWDALLGPEGGELSASVAAQFNLNSFAIERAARTGYVAPGGNGRPAPDRLWDACRLAARPLMEGLAQRLDSRATWDDIVLPAEQSGLLREIADQVRQRGRVYQDWGFAARMNRGLGISALFAGESGTGKTMAAEVLANELNLDLYRIDLSAVVSKYIGETEKNLRRLFDAAEDGGAILFFDEADALFGKRSEVKDSHDRYANIEINYLLQRMEAYTGLAVLATNMKSALDQAFTRRLRFIVQFPFPGLEERARIWRKVFPPGVPIQSLDHDRLARLNLSGGSIHNVALNAAFLAARAGSSVTMALVLEAARAEYRKLERPINEMDFR